MQLAHALKNILKTSHLLHHKIALKTNLNNFFCINLFPIDKKTDGFVLSAMFIWTA